MQHIAHGYTETSPVQVFQFYCFRHFVVPALSSGLKQNIEIMGRSSDLSHVPGTFPTNRSVAFVAVMGATAHPETVSEKYSSGTVRESHPCSLLNLIQQIPEF